MNNSSATDGSPLSVLGSAFETVDGIGVPTTALDRDVAAQRQSSHSFRHSRRCRRRRHRSIHVVVVAAVVAFLIVRSTATNALAKPSLPTKRQVSIVTGANGYIGREIVDQLLMRKKEHGGSGSDTDHPHVVQEILCLVRPKRVEEESSYWDQVGTTSNQCTIQVLPYDMLDGGKTITDALQRAFEKDGSVAVGAENNEEKNGGVDVCVYHVASVFGPSRDHVQTSKDNVRGTVDLVNALSLFPGCRLVLTSSMAAVRGSGQVPQNGSYYTCQDWNALSQLDENNWGSSYQWSKAESERVAWELAKKHMIPMASICPSFVFGPPTGSLSTSSSNNIGRQHLSSSFSITLVGQWVRGESQVQSRLCVDIRDVAQAHIAAGHRQEAMGTRFIVSTEARIPSEEMAMELQRVCQQTGMGDPKAVTFDSAFVGGAIPIGSREVEATDRLKDLLGVTLRPVQET